MARTTHLHALQAENRAGLLGRHHLVPHEITAERSARAARGRIFDDAEVRARTCGCIPWRLSFAGSVGKQKTPCACTRADRETDRTRRVCTTRCPPRRASRAARTETARRTTRPARAGRCPRPPAPAGRARGRGAARIGDRFGERRVRLRHPREAQLVAAATSAPPAPGRCRGRTRSARGPRSITPARASANVLPIVGCPAIGSSSPGVKMRIRDVGVGPLGRQHECRLGEVHLLRDRLHRLGRQAAAVEKDRELIAAEQVIGEDVVVEIAI